MTRFVFLSDTHNQHKDLILPEGDILVHSGDACLHGTVKEFASFVEWFRNVEGFKHKIFVPGNHDMFVEEAYHMSMSMLDDDVHMLINRSIILDDISIYGAPWSPNLRGWAFCPGDAIVHEWKKIPDKVDLLITHSPAYDLMDKPHPPAQSPKYGCKDLAEALLKRRIRYHAFGHIHGSYGMSNYNDRIMINACNCDEEYDLINKPIVVDIHPE